MKYLTKYLLEIKSNKTNEISNKLSIERYLIKYLINSLFKLKLNNFNKLSNKLSIERY